MGTTVLTVKDILRDELDAPFQLGCELGFLTAFRWVTILVRDELTMEGSTKEVLLERVLKVVESNRRLGRRGRDGKRLSRW